MKNVMDIIRTLKVMPVSELNVHEQISLEHMKMLKRLFTTTKIFTNPIIVDEKSLNVLDGTHRLIALKELGYKNILCQMVDYSSKEIKLGTWFPAFKFKKPAEGFVLKHEGEYGHSFEEGMKMLEKNEAAFMLVQMQGGKKRCAVFKTKKPTLKEFYAAQESIISDMEKMNYVIYIPDELAEGYLKEGYNVLYRRGYTKKEVLDSVKNNKPLPAKSTRHVIPDRLLGANIPMEYLVVDTEKAQEELVKIIEKRAARSAIRYYPEPVLVLDDY